MNAYDLLSEFSPTEAAEAITGIIQPKTPEEKKTLDLVIRRLLADINSRELPATITETQEIREERIGMRRISIDDTRDHRPVIQHPYTVTKISIALADLLTWCELNRKRPALLPPSEKPLDPREKQSLLGIIRAVAELHGIRSGSDYSRKEAEALLVELAEKGISEPCNAKTLSKHMSAAFKPR